MSAGVTPSTARHADVLRRIARDAPQAPADALTDLVYLRYHVRDRRALRDLRSGTGADTTVREREGSRLAAALTAACRTSSYRDPGWEVVGRAGAEWRLRRGAVVVRARDEDVTVGAGGTVDVRMPARRPYASPGYFTVFGAHGPAVGGDEPLCRIYLNVPPAHAPLVVAVATEQFGRIPSGTTLKVLNHPRAFGRTDTAVLYLRRSLVTGRDPRVRALLRAVAPYCRPAVPGFAYRAAPGIGMADEPAGAAGRGESFGRHRAGIVARALTAEPGDGQDDAAARRRLRRIVDAFADQGLDAGRPYLEAGATDFPHGGLL